MEYREQKRKNIILFSPLSVNYYTNAHDLSEIKYLELVAQIAANFEGKEIPPGNITSGYK